MYTHTFVRWGCAHWYQHIWKFAFCRALVQIYVFFCGNVGFICAYVEFFCGYVGFFCVYVGFFCGYLGLICGYTMSHVTHVSDVVVLLVSAYVTYANESCLIWAWVRSLMRMSHVTCENESCHMWKWVMSHGRTSHVTYAMSHVIHLSDERVPIDVNPCHSYICEWVMLHMRMSHITYGNESCYVWKWVMSHLRPSHVYYTIGHVTRLSDERVPIDVNTCHGHMCEWVMSHMRTRRVIYGNESCYVWK